MPKIYSILLLSVFLVFPASNACFSYRDKSSISEFNCMVDRSVILIKGTPGILVRPSNCKDYIFKEEEMLKALKIFVREYSEEFDTTELEVWKKLSGLEIEVSILPRTVNSAYDIHGKLVKHVPVNGLAISKNLIWVEIKTKNISSSALIHELIHIIIWRDQIHHGDPDHEGKEFSGWNIRHTKLINRINNILLDLDI